MVGHGLLLAGLVVLAAPAQAAPGFKTWISRAERSNSPGETAVYYTRALQTWTPAVGNRAKASALYNRGLAYQRMKYLDKAIKDYTESLMIVPANKDALMNRGVAYKQAGDLRMAVRDYTQLIDMGTKDPDVFLYRGVANLAMNQESAAVKDLSRYIRMRPNNPEAYEQRAQANMKLHDYGAAAEDYGKILQLMPGDSYAKQNLSLAKRRAALGTAAPVRMPQAASHPALSGGKLPSLDDPALGGKPLPAAAPVVNTVLRRHARREEAPEPPTLDWEKYAVPAGAGATVLILLGAGIASLAGKRKARKAGAVLQEIAGAAAKAVQLGPAAPANDPQLFHKYRAEGGALRKLSTEQLAFILPDGSGAEAARELGAVSALRAARLLCERGRNAAALELLTDDVVKDVCGAGDGARQVIDIVIKGNALDAFMTRHSAGFRPPEFYASCARALLAARKYEPALSMLTRKDPASWTPDELKDAFELKVRLGQADESAAMLGRVKTVFPPSAHAAFFYELAQKAEASGPSALAAELYRAASEAGYQDAAQRLAATEAALAQAKAQAAPPAAQPQEPAAAPQTAVQPLPSPVGLIKGRYLLGPELGRGGMGIVYEGTDRQMKRKVALKQMHPAVRDSREARKRFLQGAEIVSRLAHPYIVGIHDIVEEKDEIYLVFEYVDGAPLSAYLTGGNKISLSQSKGVMKHVCEAIAAAHRARVLHRDIKPGNIMVDKNGFAKVMDFDIAREAKVAISQITSKDATGTPAYMAPEQHLGEPHRASDVFALGVTLFEMLAGQLPFKGPDFLVQKERKKYPPIRMLVPSLPQGIEPLMDALLEPDPKKRLDDPLDLFERLRAL